MVGVHDYINLSWIADYAAGECNGLAQARAFGRAFTEEVHQPAYRDYDILMSTGNTAAWANVVSLLCDNGAYILCEEHVSSTLPAFRSAQS